MKKVIIGSVFSASFSVLMCVLFLGGVIPGLSLKAGIPIAWVTSLAAAFLAGVVLRPQEGDAGKEREGGGEETGTERVSSPPGPTGKRGYELYLRVVRYMEEKKPFLDEKLDLERLAKGVFSNKAYVSKYVNHYSGRNVRKFVNWYRVQYAKDLLKADPHLRMEDVSAQSGFHTTVSFNMAFRLFEGKTPTQWLEEYVDSLRKR